MSVAEKYDKWRKKFRVNSNMKEFNDYFQEVNNALGGSGGDILASDVITDDDSNVQVKINELEAATSTNASDISTNTSAIATNTGAISTNTSAIATNASAITTNTNNIATNTSDIATNASAIAQNTTDISTNASNIATNTGAISTNTSDIADLQSLTPFISIADTTSSVTISTSADTTFMQFLATNQNQNDTAYFSYAGDTLTILQAGLYNFNIGVNAEKSGGGNGNLEIKFLVNDTLGKNSVGLIQIDNDGTIATGFSGSLILNANDTVKIVFQNQGAGTLTASTTATTDAFRLQVYKIGN